MYRKQILSFWSNFERFQKYCEIKLPPRFYNRLVIVFTFENQLFVYNILQFSVRSCAVHKQTTAERVSFAAFLKKFLRI